MIYIQGKPQGVITTGLEDIPAGRNCFDLERLKPKQVEEPPSKWEAYLQRNREKTLARYHKNKVLKSNVGNPFCLPITTPSQSQRTQAIAGNSV
jgi:hypothetical protein